ncbi:MAG: hypothetical protein ACQXXJ_05340, partial [Candidatus Bathyarchaeia archaeon]
LARAGFTDFRTNTFLGNLVFDAKLPPRIQELAVKCGKTLGKNHEAWVFALDAMVNVGENKQVDDETVKAELQKAAEPFAAVAKVKKDEARLREFRTASWKQHSKLT